MEKKLGELAVAVGKNAKDLLKKTKDGATKIVDQNEDGKIQSFEKI